LVQRGDKILRDDIYHTLISSNLEDPIVVVHEARYKFIPVIDPIIEMTSRRYEAMSNSDGCFGSGFFAEMMFVLRADTGILAQLNIFPWEATTCMRVTQVPWNM